MESINIFGQPLVSCSTEPLTGFLRDGCCNTNELDYGVHTVCIIATEAFLTFSKQQGNDLSTPRPEWGFAGIKPGDQWCLCASRFKDAVDNACAPFVVLEATHEKTLDIVDMEDLIKYAYKDKIT